MVRFTNGERRVQKVNRVVNPLDGCKTDGEIMVDIMNRMGYKQPPYTPDTMLDEISKIVPFFAGITWDRLGKNGLQWPVTPDGEDTQILHGESFKRGKGKFHAFDFTPSQEIINHQAEFPYTLTTGRILEHYNVGTMTRRTGNADLISKDTLLIHPDDAHKKGVESGATVRLKSARGSVELHAELSTIVNPGVLFTTFHFPEIMVNNITGDSHDEETLCPEYKVVAVDFELIK